MKKQSPKKANLDEVWLEFTGQIAEIELLLRDIRSSTKKEYDLIIKNEEYIKQIPGNVICADSMHNMFFRDVQNGKHIFYDMRNISQEESKRRLLLRKNKLFQWLLVEGYEAFERFLVHIYALIKSMGTG